MSPRPTPQHSKPRPRREEILDQATQLFAERGYEGTSMADFAERVALRKASLFHHFASKEALYVEVLARWRIPSIHRMPKTSRKTACSRTILSNAPIRRSSQSSRMVGRHWYQ